MENTDSFFDQPPGGDSDGMVVNGRYAITHPDSGKPATWQRASNFGSPLSDHHALTRWQLRELIRGLNKREDLLELIRTATEISNAQADAWVKSAHEAAATDAKANRGTAVHEVLRAYDTGQEYSERYAHIVNGYSAELTRQRLTPVGTEFTVLNVPLGAAGRADRVYREGDGSYVLGDVKTGRLDYAVHDFAVQCAVYNTSKYLVDDNGCPHPLPWPLRQDYAVLIHVDPVTGESSTYRLDMTSARRAANLAVQVRAWRNTKDVALPYVPPDAATIENDAKWANAGLASDVARVVEVDAPPSGMVAAFAAGGLALDRDVPPFQHSTAEQNLPDDHPGREADESVAAYHARLADEDNRAQAFGQRTPSAAEQAVADVRQRSTALGYAPDVRLTAEHVARVNAGVGPLGAAPLPPHYDTKIGEQRIRPDGVTVYWTGRDWEALNPVQVANLAIPSDGPRAGMPLTGLTQVFQLGEWMDFPPTMSDAVMVAEHEAAPRPEYAVPPAIDPETEAAELAKLPKVELQRMLKALGGPDLAHHRSWLANEIVKRKNAGGSQSVTVGAPATPSTAPAPAAEQTPHTLDLIRSAASVADLSRLREKIVSVGGDQAWNDEMTQAARDRVTELDEGDRQSVLARIDRAGGSQELAALWAELTLSGTAPSHWTGEYQDAATLRLNTINAATTAAPPVNPFD